MVRKILVAAVAALIPVSAFADYNANGGFIVTAVATYADTDSIYVTVSAPPAHAACSNAHFVLSGAVPADRRKAMLSRLLLAKAEGTPVNFGYDATGDCAEGFIRLHRVG